jgi:hypothetical protein
MEEVDGRPTPSALVVERGGIHQRLWRATRASLVPSPAAFAKPVRFATTVATIDAGRIAASRTPEAGGVLCPGHEASPDLPGRSCPLQSPQSPTRPSSLGANIKRNIAELPSAIAGRALTRAVDSRLNAR